MLKTKKKAEEVLSNFSKMVAGRLKLFDLANLSVLFFVQVFCVQPQKTLCILCACNTQVFCGYN